MSSPSSFTGRGVSFDEDLGASTRYSLDRTPSRRSPSSGYPTTKCCRTPQADRLYRESFDKNMIDTDEYPQTAAMLAGLALKRRWQLRRRADGKSTEAPNLVMSSAVQVCWEKFCNYFEVEPRYVPISEEHRELDGHDLDRYVDENTIGVVAIMGVTYTGAYEPVAEIAAALDRIAAATGVDVPIHVDGASGAMVAPFTRPDLFWDFRIERVASINTSGHKYGLVYPGLGWVVWRDRSAAPKELIFSVSYLGGDMPTMTLNFSRPGAQVLLQYYLFLRLGHSGYTRVQRSCLDIARHLADGIGALDCFELWSERMDIPAFAWRLKPGHTALWNPHHLSDRLRMHGWQVPAYPMPDNLTDVHH